MGKLFFMYNIHLKLVLIILFLQHQRVMSSPGTSQVDNQESYFITLGSKNFTHQVLESVDSWIVLFHKNQIGDSWRELSRTTRGLVWLGTIDITKETDILTTLAVDQSEPSSVRVYPYGHTNVKQSQWQTVKDWREAERFAVKSIPDNISVITSNKIENFIKESHATDPARFPTFIISDRRDTTPLFRAIKQRFQRYFNIGTMVNPTQDDLLKLGFKDKPSAILNSLLVVVKEQVTEPRKPSKSKSVKPGKKPASKKKPDPPKYTTHVVPYNRERLGELSYSSMMQFFFSVNHQFRHTLPSSPNSETKTVSMMSDIMDIEQERFDELFDRKVVSDSKKTKSANVDDNVATSQDPPEASGGSCPFGFDKKLNQAKNVDSKDKGKVEITIDKPEKSNMKKVEL